MAASGLVDSAAHTSHQEPRFLLSFVLSGPKNYFLNTSLCGPKMTTGVLSVIPDTRISRSEKVAFMCFLLRIRK